MRATFCSKKLDENSRHYEAQETITVNVVVSDIGEWSVPLVPIPIPKPK